MKWLAPHTLIFVTIVILAATQVATWIFTLVVYFFTEFWTSIIVGVSAIVVMVVSFVCTRFARANAVGTVWFLLPPLLFTVAPIVYTVFFSTPVTEPEQPVSVVQTLIEIIPMIARFVIPVVLLSLAYWQVSKRMRVDV